MRALKQRAQAGDPVAQFTIGIAFARGNDVPQDGTLAAWWLRRAARADDAHAQAYLGHMYYWGDGIDRDLGNAAYWYRRAAEKGLPEAQFVLGYMLDTGLGMDKDLARAALWYERAARAGHPGAQLNLRARGETAAPGRSDPPLHQGSKPTSAPMAPAAWVGAPRMTKMRGAMLFVAAFGSDEAAALGWDALGRRHADVFAGLEPHFERVDLGAARGGYVRVLVGPVPDEVRAAALCRTLAARGTFCSVVQ